MIEDRPVYWTFIQKKVIRVFLESLETLILPLQIQELYDFLSLCNKFLEIGNDFAGPTNAVNSLEDFLRDCVCARYIAEFKSQ